MNSYGKIKIKLNEFLIERNIAKLRASKDTGIDYKVILKYCKSPDTMISVNKEVIARICHTYGCKVEDLIEHVEDDQEYHIKNYILNSHGR